MPSLSDENLILLKYTGSKWISLSRSGKATDKNTHTRHCMNRIIHNLWKVQFACLRITLLLLLFELYLYIYAHVQASDCWCISYLGAHINGNKTKNNPPKNFALKIASLGSERERERKSELDKKCSGFAPNMQNVKLNWTCCYSLSLPLSQNTPISVYLSSILCAIALFLGDIFPASNSFSTRAPNFSVSRFRNPESAIPFIIFCFRNHRNAIG